MRRYNWEFEFDPTFPMHIFPFTVVGNRDQMHWHRYHEIGLCTGGEGQFVYLNKVFPIAKGDIVISNNYESHVAISQPNGKTEYLFFIFLPSVISSPEGSTVDAQYLRFLQYNPLLFKNHIPAGEPAAAELGRLIRRAYEVYSGKDPFRQMELDILLRQLLLTLSRARGSIGETDKGGQYQHPKILEAQSYINDHYTAPLTIKQVADHLELNESYFRHLFKDELQVSFKTYLTLLRLSSAQKLLLASDRSINEIIQDVGYSNISQFYKIFFENYKMTPAEYRRRYRGAAVTESEPI